MTDSHELDNRLRAFIQTPDNFLDIMGLVNALHHETVWATDRPYAIAIEGQTLTPVFTTQKDLESFCQEQASAKEENWILRPSLEVLEEVLVKRVNGIVYNLKRQGDMGNSTVFKADEMVTFINNYTIMLNNLLSEANQKADILERYYIIPAFYLTLEQGQEERIFPTMSNESGDSYVPIFSNLPSFAKWYNDDNFGGAFRKAKGMVTTGKIKDILQPISGENDIDNTLGVVINPFDEEQVMVDWQAVQ